MVDAYAYRYGYAQRYRGPLRKECPHCQSPMLVHRQPADPSRNYKDGVGKHLISIAKCINPTCPFLSSKNIKEERQ